MILMVALEALEARKQRKSKERVISSGKGVQSGFSVVQPIHSIHAQVASPPILKH